MIIETLLLQGSLLENSAVNTPTVYKSQCYQCNVRVQAQQHSLKACSYHLLAELAACMLVVVHLCSAELVLPKF